MPPAFFPVGLNLVGRKCVVIGLPSDREANEKEAALRAAGAEVRWIRDPAALRENDVRDAFLVIFTPQEEAGAAKLRSLADRHKFLFCAIDQPRYGFVAMTALVAFGRGRIAISTGGAAPRIAGMLCNALQTALDETFARFLDCFAAQRRLARREVADPARRRERMIEAAQGFEVEVRLTYPAWFREELRGLGPAVIEEP